MQKNTININELGHKYLRDELTLEESAVFEIELLENPKLLESLEMDGVLINNLRQATELSVKRQRGNFFLYFFPGKWKYSIAAVTLACVTLAFFTQYSWFMRDYSSAKASIVYLYSFRSAESKAVNLVIGKSSEAVVMVLQPGDIVADELNVEIIHDNRVIKQFDQVLANSNGDFVIILDSSLFTKKEYQVVMYPSDGKEKKEIINLIVFRESLSINK